MRLLLDTHVLIWWDSGSAMKPETIEAIQVADQVHVSTASAWEISIKAALGRLETDRRLDDVVGGSGFEELPIRFSHAAAVRHLPPHHRDPFDRMLVGQAQVEGLTIVTRDAALTRYEVEILPA